MPIISKVGRRHRSVKAVNLTIHTLLLLGATVIVYPFLIMISGSLKSEVDFNNLNIAPKYLFDDLTLYHRYLITKYNNVTTALFYNLKYPHGLIEQVPESKFVAPALLTDYANFINLDIKHSLVYQVC